MRTGGLAVVALVAAALAGCSDDGGDARLSAPPMPTLGQKSVLPFTVTGASELEGRCFDGATEFGESCHVLRIEVDNRKGAADVDFDAGTWSALLGDGRSVQFGQATPGRVAAGQLEDVDVQFTLKTAWPDVAEAHWDGFTTYGSSSVPPY